MEYLKIIIDFLYSIKNEIIGVLVGMFIPALFELIKKAFHHMFQTKFNMVVTFDKEKKQIAKAIHFQKNVYDKSADPSDNYKSTYRKQINKSEISLKFLILNMGEVEVKDYTVQFEFNPGCKIIDKKNRDFITIDNQIMVVKAQSDLILEDINIKPLHSDDKVKINYTVTTKKYKTKGKLTILLDKIFDTVIVNDMTLEGVKDCIEYEPLVVDKHTF